MRGEKEKRRHRSVLRLPIAHMASLFTRLFKSCSLPNIQSRAPAVRWVLPRALRVPNQGEIFASDHKKDTSVVNVL